MRHIVWDWNGTLLDDLDIVVDSVNAALAEFDAGPISLDDYRNNYTRPVVKFYEVLLGRPVADREWRRLDIIFHDAYREALPQVRLAHDAEEALRAALDAGWSQSLLSMFPHDELMEVVARHRLDRYLVAVDGLRGLRGDRKVSYLEAHLQRLAPTFGGHIDPAGVLVIGDALDDAAAAEALGLQCILFAGGSHPRDELAATGFPVTDSLVEAVELGNVSRRERMP
jgi:phosphoglycolate phosphatase-like HAD superfamily hydrolase